MRTAALLASFTLLSLLTLGAPCPGGGSPDGGPSGEGEGEGAAGEGEGAAGEGEGAAGEGEGEGASGGAGAGSCDWTLAGIHNCQDYATGYQNPTGVCQVNGGTYTANGACDHTGSAGGCIQVDNFGTKTTWFYGNNTPDAVRTSCEQQGGTYVAP